MNIQPAGGTDTRPDTDVVSRTIDTPVGPLTIIASGVGVRAVLWPDDDEGRVPDAANIDLIDRESTDDPESSEQTEILDAAVAQLGEYFAGTRTGFDLALDPVGTDFQQLAWKALRAIPFGRTISYGEQAEQMGDRRKARAVGAANGKNPISIIVPCHRVVGSNGSLTGFAGGIDTKRMLLDHERRVSGHTLV